MSLVRGCGGTLSTRGEDGFLGYLVSKVIEYKYFISFICHSKHYFKFLYFTGKYYRQCMLASFVCVA